MTLLTTYIREASAAALSDEFLKLVSDAAKLIGSIVSSEYAAMMHNFEGDRIHTGLIVSAERSGPG